MQSLMAAGDGTTVRVSATNHCKHTVTCLPHQTWRDTVGDWQTTNREMMVSSKLRAVLNLCFPFNRSQAVNCKSLNNISQVRLMCDLSLLLFAGPFQAAIIHFVAADSTRCGWCVGHLWACKHSGE